MELHVDIPQDVPIIPNNNLIYWGGGGKIFSIIVQITIQDPLISIDRARALVLFQQKTKSI